MTSWDVGIHSPNREVLAMNNLLKCGALAIVCVLPLGARAQNAQSDAVKAGDSAEAAEPAMKVDTATKGTTGDAAHSTSNKMEPGSQGAGNGTNATTSAAPPPAVSNKMNGDGAQVK
jgi:hypothetical protein